MHFRTSQVVLGGGKQKYVDEFLFMYGNVCMRGENEKTSRVLSTNLVEKYALSTAQSSPADGLYLSVECAMETTITCLFNSVK